ASRDSVVVSWKTDELTNGKVYYGIVNVNEEEPVVFDTDFTVSEHSVTINGLEPHSTYKYKVESVDVSGNLIQSPELTFSTSPDTVKPVISDVLPVSGSTVGVKSVGFKVSDDVGVSVQSIVLTINDTAVGPLDCTNESGLAQCSGTLSQIKAGSNSLIIGAKDSSGNAAVSVTTNFVFNQPPSLDIGENFSVQEGESFSLTLKMQDSDNDALSFEVDFGDGTTIEKGSVSSTSTQKTKTLTHYYDSKSVCSENTCIIKVKLSDGKAVEEKSVSVKIEEGFLKMDVVKPTKGAYYDKSEKIDLRVKLQDTTGNIVSNAVITATTINGVETVLKEENEKGYYSGSMTTSYKSESDSTISFKASALLENISRETTQQITINLSPLTLIKEFIVLPEQETYFIGDKLEKVKLKLLFSENNPLIPGKDFDVNGLKLVLKNSESEKVIELNVVGSELVGDLNYVLSEKDVEKELSLKILNDFEDFYGNKITSSEFKFSIMAESSELKITLIKPENGFTAGFGQEVMTSIKLEGESLSNESVTINNESCKKNENVFECLVLIPLQAETKNENFNLNVKATAEKNGKKINSAKTFYFQLKPASFSFVYPKDGQTILESLNEIRVNVTYPDGSIVKENELNAVINGQNVKLSKSVDKSYFTGSFPLIQGQQSLELMIPEISTAKQTITANLLPQELNITLVIGIMVVLVLIVIIYVKSLQKKENIAQLEQQRDELKALMKKLKFELFKRHISEQEYKQRLMEAQSKLDVIEAKIGTRKEKMKEKKEKVKEKDKKQREQFFGPEKKIEPKQDERKKSSLTEEDVIERLSALLEPYVEKYSEAEIRTAIMQEGYPLKIAQKVAEKLAKKKKKPVKETQTKSALFIGKAEEKEVKQVKREPVVDEKEVVMEKLKALSSKEGKEIKKGFWGKSLFKKKEKKDKIDVKQFEKAETINPKSWKK
ncbi:MAG: fibronectin type III domain-containing protein, partial [archaeon]